MTIYALGGKGQEIMRTLRVLIWASVTLLPLLLPAALVAQTLSGFIGALVALFPLLLPAALVAWGIAAISQRLGGPGTLTFRIIFILGSAGTLYFLFLDYHAGIATNFKYLFFSEDRLAREDIFLPSTTYWRGRISGTDSQEIFRGIVAKKFSHESVNNIVRYLEISGLRCAGPFTYEKPHHYSCGYRGKNKPAISPTWRIAIEYEDSGSFNSPYIHQFFELWP